MQSNRTIQDVIDSGDTIRAYCPAYLCNHNAALDMLALRDRFGPDHGALYDDLRHYLICSKCGGKKIGLIYAPDETKTGGMMSPAGNAYQKAREGR